MFLEALSVSHQEMSHQAEVIRKYHLLSSAENTCRLHILQLCASASCSFSPSFLFHSFSSLCSHPRCCWYRACFRLWSDSTWFIWQAFNPACACPSASDRKHPRACVSATKSGSLSFSGCNLQPECTATNHIYFCTLELHGVRSGVAQYLPNGYGMMYCVCTCIEKRSFWRGMIGN